MKSTKRALLFVLYMVAIPCPAQSPLDIEDAWMSETLPGTGMSAAYFTARNMGSQSMSIQSASSSEARKITLHQTEIIDGISRMSALNELEIAAGSSVQLKPGGIHLMVQAGDRGYKAGESVQINLHLTTGEVVPVGFAVRRADSHQHHHHH